MRLHFFHRPGAALDDALLRELWSFRASIMRMKPDLDLEQDFTHFAAHCRASSGVHGWRDARGHVRGMGAVEVRRLVAGGERVLLFLAEYTISDAAVRGDVQITLGYLRALGALLRPGDERLAWYAGGVGYPASFLALGRLGAAAWLDGEPGLPPVARDLLDVIGREVAAPKRDPATRRVAMPTLPPPLRPSLRHEPEAQRYLARNPDWEQGYGLGFLAHGSALAVVAGLFRSLGRRARRKL